MPVDDRDYVRGEHPSSCTCADCCARRLKRLKKEAHPDYVSICPRCGQKSLWHNVKEHKYECLNLKCMAVGSSPDEIARKIEQSSRNIKSDGTVHYSNYVDSGVVDSRSSGPRKAGGNKSRKTASSGIPNWLIALLLMFALSICGWGISIFVGSFVPFWILFGFSLIYSVEKWFGYITRKHKGIGKLYRLLLNFSILSLFGLMVWSGVRLFSQKLAYSPLTGSLIFLAEFVFFIWMCRVISKNRWRWPSMKLTIFSLLCLFIVFTFAGVQPFSTYKDNLLVSWKTITTTPPPTQTIPAPETPSKIAPVKPPEPIPIKPPIATVSKYTLQEVASQIHTLINNERTKQGLSPLRVDILLTNLAEEHSESMVLNGFFGHERAPGERIFGYSQQPGTLRGENISKTPQRRVIPGPYLTLEEVCTWVVSGWMSSPGHSNNILEPKFTRTGIGVGLLEEYLYITQIFEATPIPIPPDKPTLRNPSWEELKAFLLEDDTDKHPYTFPTFVCEDFARTLQSNAKKAGWRCAFLSVHLEGYPDWFHYGIPSSTDHALNAFETTDRGLIYIDVTRSAGSGPRDQDCMVDVQIGKQYLPRLIFPSGDWSSPLSMGTITSIGNPNW